LGDAVSELSGVVLRVEGDGSPEVETVASEGFCNSLRHAFSSGAEAMVAAPVAIYLRNVLRGILFTDASFY
jgi:hypothetical protein